MVETKDILIKAKNVSLNKQLSENEKNNAIICMANSLIENSDEILKANLLDIEDAKDKVSSVMIDRLSLDKDRIKSMAEGMINVSKLKDPVGKIIENKKHTNGMNISKITVPFGVVAIIYESRPNVTSDAAVLAFKSGNVCILRSGKEAYRSAYAIVKALKEGLIKFNINPDYINLIEDTSRQSANDLMTAVGFVDLLIPRGGKGLIKACTDNAKVPCIETGTGICHIYIDETADFNKALDIIYNAKVSRPSVCNAAEVCLVSRKTANHFLPLLHKRLCENNDSQNVELIGTDEVNKIINVTLCDELSFDTEFLDYKMAVKIVDNVNEAIEHISKHSTKHSDAIISSTQENIELFTKMVDSAAVYVNASTRFTDGGEFGLGCEMGISTQKLHARGPMGLNELTTYKYIINGNGQIR